MAEIDAQLKEIEKIFLEMEDRKKGARRSDELRAFRHYFRDAYSYELRYEKLKPVIEAASKLREAYRKDIERFLREIEVD